MREDPHVVVGVFLLRGVRRCPTLPHPPGCSTIGAVGLSFRVRDGSGRFPHAMAAVTLFGWPSHHLWVVFGLQFYFIFVKPVVVSEPRKNPGLVCCFGAVWWTRQLLVFLVFIHPTVFFRVVGVL